MKKTGITITCIALIVLTVTSCKKPQDGQTGAQGPAGPSLKGNIQGFIQLYDQYGTRDYFKLDSATVSIDGSSTSSLSDVSGKYLFSNLSTGIYNFSIAGRAGYAPSKLQGIEITGNGTISRDIRLSQVPTWSVSTVTAIDTTIGTSGTHNLKIRVVMPTPDTKARQIAVFIDIASGVSSTSYLWAYNINVPANATTVNSVLAPTSTFLNGANLPSGSNIYVIAYPASYGYQNNSTYTDYNTDRVIYNALNFSSTAIAQTTIQ